MDPVGIELITSRLWQLRQLAVVQHVRFMPLKLCRKTQSQWHARGCPEQRTNLHWHADISASKRLNVMVFLWSFFDYSQVFMQSIAVPPEHHK